MNEGDEPPAGLKSSVKWIIPILITIILIQGATAITITAKPSVGGSGYSYTWHTRSWSNYCPGCGHSGTLTINPKGVPERELTCRRCDADYCGVTGWDKSHSRRWRLTPGHGGVGGVEKEPERVDAGREALAENKYKQLWEKNKEKINPAHNLLHRES